MRTFISKIFGCQRGATAVEYSLILSLIMLALIGGLSELASSTVGMWDNVSNDVTEAEQGE